MKNKDRNGAALCEPRCHDEFGWLKCSLVVFERDPTGPEACPSYGGGGMQSCNDCADTVAAFLRRAYDARAVRMEHHVKENHGFEPLP